MELQHFFFYEAIYCMLFGIQEYLAIMGFKLKMIILYPYFGRHDISRTPPAQKIICIFISILEFRADLILEEKKLIDGIFFKME